MSTEAELSTLPLREAETIAPALAMWCIRWILPADVGPRTPLAFSGSAARSIGRAPDRDVVLASPSVSRAHAELRVAGRHVGIHDSGSRNGIFVNGRRSSGRLLRQGDVLRIGDCIGVVEEDYGSEPAGPVLEARGFHARGLLRAALAPLERLARTDLPIVVQGATGTGKERAARAVHGWSGRTGGFVAINCAALPEQLAEAELFGYRRGAFSGAEQSSLGHFRAAQGGTLFLDEIAELSPRLQAKLLRALELREVQPLGESRTFAVDVRIVAAVQEALASGVARGTFRADLHARLNGFTFELPLLKERISELPSLFAYLLHEKSGGFPPRVDARLVERFCLHDWPGNVRELEMVARRLLGLHGHETCLLPEHVSDSLPEPVERAIDERHLVEIDTSESDFSRDERDLSSLLDGLRETRGNVARAAHLSRISRQRAYRLLQARPGFDLAEYRRTEVT